jgi:hypothetical protein
VLLGFEKDLKMAIKRKTVREDGKIFWAYKHKNGTKKEVWLSPKVFERWDQVRKNYVNKKYKKYLEQQNELPDEERNYRGKCDPQTGLYFIRVSTCGKPVFGSKEELEKYINQNKKSKSRYYYRCAKLPAPTFCVGDPHPQTPNLFVKRIFGHKIYWGTKKEADNNIENRNNSYKKYKNKNKDSIKDRNKQARNIVMENLKNNPHLKRRRSDIDPILGRFFWGYSCRGKEVWLRKDAFERRHKNTKVKRNLNRIKKKGEQNGGGCVTNENNKTIIY